MKVRAIAVGCYPDGSGIPTFRQVGEVFELRPGDEDRLGKWMEPVIESALSLGPRQRARTRRRAVRLLQELGQLAPDLGADSKQLVGQKLDELQRKLQPEAGAQPRTAESMDTLSELARAESGDPL